MRNILLLAGLTGLFIGWNMPNHYPLWTTFHGELAAAAGACALFAALLWQPASTASGSANVGAQLGAIQLRLPAAARVALLVALLPPLQYAVGQLDFHGDALLGFLYIAGAAIALYAGQLWAAQAGAAKVLRTLFLTVVWSGLAAGGLALVQWFRLPNPGWWAMNLIDSRPYGNFAQPNLFGLAMVLSIVAATALFETRVLQHRFSFYLLLLFFGWAVLVSESRASLLALLVVAGFWLGTQRRVPSRLHWAEVTAALLLSWLVHGALAGIEEALYLKAAAARVVLDVGPREAIWLQFWAAIRAHPWFGYGFGQGVLALREVAAQMPPARNTIYAHSVVLDLMAWFGIPLGLGLAVALGAWMLSWLRRTDNVELNAQRHWVFAFWLALAVQSLLEFPYAHTFFLLPAALLAGAITTAPNAAAGSSSTRRVKPSVTALALAALCGGLLALTAWDYLQFEEEFRVNRFERARFTQTEEHVPHSGPTMLDQLAALNASAQYKIGPNMSPDEIKQLGRLARRFHLLPTRIDYAKALALNGRMAEADAELQMIRGIYHPALWARIEQDWQNWMQEHRVDLPSSP